MSIKERGERMSLFGDIANAIGHTVDSLAQDIGADVSVLENVVNDLNSFGVDVLSTAAKLGLDTAGFLRSIINLMKVDPHQLFLQELTGPLKRMDEPLYQLSQQWMQMVHLHNGTAQAINAHFNDLFQSEGSYSYSGPAADILWETNQNYQHYFTTVLVEHAQVQQTRHAALNGYVNDYLSQMPSKVYSLSTPLAAFGVLSLQTAASAPPAAPPSGLQQLIQNTENTIGDLDQDSEGVPPGPEDPIWDFFWILIIVLVIFVAILLLINWIAGLFSNHQNQQKNTTTPQPTPIPTPTPGLLPNGLTPAQQQEVNDIMADASKEGLVVDQRDVEALVRAGYDRNTILAMLRAGNLKTSQGMTYTTPGGYVYTGHAMSHVGVSDTDLKDLTSKNNKSGGKGLATSFPDEATAQAAVNFAIAHDTDLQNFIRAAVPNSSIQRTVCDTSQDFGHGYQRNVLPNGTIDPPTYLPHLHCVSVWLAVDASGNVFVVDAYPTTP
jgi:hypothetical protein